MPTAPYCKNCKHPQHRNDCGVDDCGCIRYEARPARTARQRIWLVNVSFFEFNRWTPKKEVRVKAQGIGGAGDPTPDVMAHLLKQGIILPGHSAGQPTGPWKP